MAVSNSIDFTVTRDDIITEALELLGVLGEGESPNSDQISSMSRTLNSLIKAWQADELNLFAIQRLYLFPKKGQNEYTLASSTSDNITDSFRETTIGTESTGTTLVVAIDPTFTIGDYVGVQVNGTEVHWTTVATVTSALQVELTAALPEAAEVGNKVFVYASKANRPMRVIESYTKQGSVDVPNRVISRKDYNMLGYKAATGPINQVYFDPQVVDAKLFVYPQTVDETMYVTVFVQRTLADLDMATNNPEIPQEWYLPLAYNLAWVSVPKYGTPQMDGARIEKGALYWYNMASDFDNEHDTSIYITPNTLER